MIKQMMTGDPNESLKTLLLFEERLKWPPGTAEACLEVERRYPGWTVYYGLSFWLYEEDGFRARPVGERFSSRFLAIAAPDPATLGKLIEREIADPSLCAERSIVRVAHQRARGGESAPDSAQESAQESAK